MRYPPGHPLPGGLGLRSAGRARAPGPGRTPRGMADELRRRPNHGRYAAQANPWTYFADSAERSRCRQQDVPYRAVSQGPLREDVLAGRLPTYSMLVPDLCHDEPRLPAGDGRRVAGGVADPDRGGARTSAAAGSPWSSPSTRTTATRATTSRRSCWPRSCTIEVVRTGGSPTRRWPRRRRGWSGLPPLREGAGTPDVLHEFGLR